MSRVVLVSQSAGLTERIGYATGGAFLLLSPNPLPSTAAELFAGLRGAPAPDIIVLDADLDPNGALQLAHNLDQSFPCVVILAATSVEPLALSAIRAGVKDLVPVESDVSEIRKALERAAHYMALRTATAAAPPPVPVVDKPDGRVVAIASPKGGVGKTTVATNVAVGLAKRYPQQVVLVDLDIHFGDCASALNLEPEFSLPDTIQGAMTRDMLTLKSLLTRHETGLYVVPGSESPVAADTVTPKDISTLLTMLAKEFQYVVVDTAPGLSEHTLAVLDKANEMVLVTTLDVPGVRGLRKELETLDDLDMLPEARHVVLNFFESSRGLTIKDVQSTIGEDVDIVLNQSRLLPQSTNQGVPLLQVNGRDPITKQLNLLVDRITGRTSEALSGFTGRRGVKVERSA
ncbi:MAG: AAA family ATPase [Actinobacteria bacterium]|nr:AAA family ATPase [Actinomycetota bacterium]